MAAPLFACLVPGRVMITDFVALDAQKMLCQIPDPSTVPQFAISLLRPELPPGYGVGIFYTSADGNWSYLGQISIQCPTQFFKAPWVSGDPELAAPGAVVQIGIMLETLDKLKEMVPADQILEFKSVDSVRGIAQDLYKYMSSFTSDGGRIPTTDCLVVPSNVIDRWFHKFTEKHRKQPFFWMEQRD